MAVDHYENFPVASWLCPPAIRLAVKSLYGFARHADDLADEGHAPWTQRLSDLETLDQALLALQSGAPVGNVPPTVQDLWPHVIAHQLDVQHLRDLLDAFAQDVRMTADGSVMQDLDQVLDYCRRSANPVGRLMLQLMREDTPAHCAMSDDICTALQLINFWQDLSVDRQRGRHYLPTQLPLPDAIAFTRQRMLRGAPLAWRIHGRMGWELRAVVHGGLRILERVERTDVAHTRPTLNGLDWLRVAMRCLSAQPPGV